MKDALDQFEVPYDAATWDLLQKRMDKTTTTDAPTAFDQRIGDVLREAEAPYQAAHWQMLNRRLNMAKVLCRRLYVAKTAEAAILLLLLLNLNFFVGKARPDAPRPAVPTFDEPIANAAQNIRHKAGMYGEVPLTPLEETDLQTAIARALGMPVASYAPLSQLNLPENIVQGLNLPVIFVTEPNDALLSEPVASAASDNTNPLASFDPLAGSALSAFANSLNMPLMERVKPAKQRRGHYYVAGYAANDQNRYLAPSDNRSGTGYRGGVAVGYRRGKWGVETGLAYTQSSYAPTPYVNKLQGDPIKGFYGTNVAEVHADFITIPVKVMRRAARVGRGSAYAVAGATVNVAAQKAYRAETVYFPGTAPSNLGTFNPDDYPTVASARGVLEGGALPQNVYATADAGIRFEHPVGRRFTAFVEPVYRHALGTNQIGPKTVRTNTVSIQAGVMASL